MTTWRTIQRMPFAEQRRMQDERLARYVREYLYPFSAHYRAVFDREGVRPEQIKTVDDLRRLPLTSKVDLLPTDQDPEQFKQFILQPTPESVKEAWPLRRKLPLLMQRWRGGTESVKQTLRQEFAPCFMTFTTGRSAEPIPFFYSKHDISNLHDTGSRLIDVIGLEPSFRIANLFPFAPHLAFWQVVFAGLEAGLMVLSTGGGRVMGSAGDLRAMSRIRAQAILGVPGYIYHLLRRGAAEGADLSSVRTVVLGAERVPPGLKAKIRTMLASMGAHDVQVFGTYGFTEARMAFAECPTDDPDVYSGYHLYPDLAIFEVIDPATGEVVPDGESGELVITPLNGRASTVFRYRTGDLVRNGIVHEPCPHCGRTVPRITSDLTRESSLKDLNTLKLKGTLVNLEDCAQILGDIEAVEEWQIELKKKDDDPHEVDEVIVRIALGEGVDGAAVRTQIRDTFRSSIEISPNKVEILELDAMLDRIGMEREMKETRFVDTRPKV